MLVEVLLKIKQVLPLHPRLAHQSMLLREMGLILLKEFLCVNVDLSSFLDSLQALLKSAGDSFVTWI